MLYFVTCVYVRGNLPVRLVIQRNCLYEYSTCVHLQLLASPFTSGSYRVSSKIHLCTIISWQVLFSITLTVFAVSFTSSKSTLVQLLALRASFICWMVSSFVFNMNSCIREKYKRISIEINICRRLLSVYFRHYNNNVHLNWYGKMHTTNDINVKVTVDLQSAFQNMLCLHNCTRYFRENHGKLHIIGKLINCRIRK